MPCGRFPSNEGYFLTQLSVLARFFFPRKSLPPKYPALCGKSKLVMVHLIWDVMFLITGSVFTSGQLQENSSIAPVKQHVAAAFHSHFDDCPDSHSQFCIHGTCRFLILEKTPACMCPLGFMGVRCEYVDLLAVVAHDQEWQSVTTLLVMCIVSCALLILVCILLNSCQRRWIIGCGRPLSFASEKPRNTLERGAFCCCSENVV
ncbi:hypothetical protein GJAV_G00028790 [Gymnothorax javanicus]|nr:hypothetical protein GJAV_G00028790 [Gymnothorax javanicus]